MDELLTWSPKDLLGDFRKVDSSVKLLERLQTISSWYHDGGVLLLGYEMFRSLIANKKTAKRCALLDDEQHENVCKELLEGPNIIIADEAHKMKNASAAVTLAAIRFRSKSRIALTGSPLANNVEEYHTMIEWVAPNYLGPIFEFRAKYVEPIQAGLWHDSTAYERRKGLKMLGVLKEDLAPKVHRADMSVLKKDLPPKKEFVITVALTELQRKAYSLYVRSMISGSASRTKDGEVTQTTLWHWLAILSLLCNHPACFNAKLHERKEAARKGATAAVEDMPSSRDGTDVEAVEAIADDFNTPVWKVGVSQELIDDETKLFKEEAPELKSIELSNKVKILCQILDAAKAAGDKTLVFSQSIPTLNFLEDLCIAQGRQYARLDGSTKMSKRQSHTKAFNQGDLDSYLISTAAGGLGLNLPGANRVVIFDFKFNPIMEEQAVGRAYRIGQKKPTFVYRFIAGGTFEDSVHNKTIFKMQLASRVVDKKNTVAWAKKKIGEFLFEPKHVETKDLSEFEGMDPKVLDKILDNQGEDSTIRAIVQSDTFEVEDDDTLTAEELKEVKQLLDDEQLKRSNPQKWQALQAVRSQQAFAQQIRPFQTPIRPPQATVNSSVPQPPMSSAQQFASSAAGRIDVRPPILPPNIATYRMDESGTFGSNNPQAASNVILPPSALEVRSPVAGTNTSPPKSTLPAPSALTRGQSPIAGVNTKIRESPPATQTPSPLGDPILPSTLPSGRMIPTEGDGANSPRTPPSFRQFLSSNQERYKKVSDPSHTLQSQTFLDSPYANMWQPGKIQSALAETAAQSQSSGNISKKTAELSSAIKNAIRDKAKDEDAVKPILDAAAASLRANLTTSQALLDSRMSPDAFVRDTIRSTNGGTSAEDITKVGISSPSHSDILPNRPLIGGSTSEAATGLKESQIIEMDVSSSKSPVSMSTQQLNPTETLAEVGTSTQSLSPSQNMSSDGADRSHAPFDRFKSFLGFRSSRH
jgi:superfamily II DNA or RNA helicase